MLRVNKSNLKECISLGNEKFQKIILIGITPFLERKIYAVTGAKKVLKLFI